MTLLSKPAFGPKLAIALITAGALINVWGLVWWFTLGRHVALSPAQQFVGYGVVLSGVVMLAVGALVGPIGQSARRVELPPVGRIG